MCEIEAIVSDFIKKEYEQSMIIWYGITGSQSRLEAHHDSDIDVMVCLDSVEYPHEKFATYRGKTIDITVFSIKCVEKIINFERLSARAIFLTKLHWLNLYCDPEGIGEEIRRSAIKIINCGSTPSLEMTNSARLNLSSSVSALRRANTVSDRKVAIVNLFYKIYFAYIVKEKSWVGLTPFVFNHYYTEAQRDYLKFLINKFSEGLESNSIKIMLSEAENLLDFFCEQSDFKFRLL